MNTTIHKFTLFFTTCLLTCSVLAQRGPQDTWYETGKVALPANCDPHDLIVTPEGTLLLTDVGNDKIHELEANGTLIRSFGSLGSGNGQFTDPVELAIGPGNRIYIADTNNHRIQILERNGTFVKAFGSNGSGDGQFNKPRGLAISSDNEVFVSEDGNHRIQVFDANGTFIRKWGSQGNLDGQFNRPLSLDVDEAEKVYIADYQNNRVSVFSKSGHFLYKFQTNGYGYGRPQIAFIKVFTSGILATGGESTGTNQNRLRLREKSGNLIKDQNFYTSSSYGAWSISLQLGNGTIIFGDRNTKELIFLRQTYRALRPNPSKDAPLPEVISVTQLSGTNHLEVKYRITDTDSAKVKAGLLAFKDGGNDLSKVIVPQTFIGSVAGKLDENTTTGTIHTVTWDAKADWNVSYGNVELAVVAQDDRQLMNFHFLTLPATDSNSTPLKISRSPVDQPDFLNAWYTLLALGDNQISFQNNEVVGNHLGSFSPSDLSGLKLWLDANDIDANGVQDVIANNSTITTWVDKSVLGNNATQSIEVNKPSYSSGSLSGKATVKFSSGKGMVTSLNLNGPYTVCVVFNCLDSGSGDSLLRRAIQGSTNWLIGPYKGQIRHHADGWVTESLVNRETSRYYSTIAVNNGVRSWFFVDGVDRTQSSTPIGSPNVIHLGGSGAYSGEFLNGHIAEVIAFDQALSSNDTNTLNEYLSSKWQINGYAQTTFASGSSTTAAGREYLFNKMNLRQATTAELTRAREAATPGVTNKFTPGFKVGPGERPVKVNEYGFDSDSTSSSHYWVVPKN
jgi:hypothetical protein